MGLLCLLDIAAVTGIVSKDTYTGGLTDFDLFITKNNRGELSYLAPLVSENISAPYFKQCFFRGGVLPPRLSQTPRLPVPRQK